jgi:hypothetical protein
MTGLATIYGGSNLRGKTATCTKDYAVAFTQADLNIPKRLSKNPKPTILFFVTN